MFFGNVCHYEGVGLSVDSHFGKGREKRLYGLLELLGLGVFCGIKVKDHICASGRPQ